MAVDPPASTEERAAFLKAIEPENLGALWNVMKRIVTPEPKSDCVPHVWRYDHVRARLMEAADIISAKEAERRVLVLENPGMRGQSRITNSLFSGIQLVMPGEVAPAHRHTQSALRLVLESSGGETVVDGEKTEMRYGDFVITPNWAWHDHGNHSADPIFWQDVLDLPLVGFLNASFAEGFGDDQQPLAKPEGDSHARYGSNMMPVDHHPGSLSSPIFNYPYDRGREALEQMRQRDDWDPFHGLKMRYVNPVNGDWAMPTIGTCLQLLPKGFKTAAYQSTDGGGFTVLEGRGRTKIGETTIEWQPRDIVVVPSWYPLEHEADDDAVLFTYSDRPVQEKLGLFRERRGNA